MNNIKHTYTIVSRNPISDEIWEVLNHNNELVEVGYLQSNFKEVVVDSEEAGQIEAYVHESILENSEQLDYIIQNGIISALENKNDEKDM